MKNRLVALFIALTLNVLPGQSQNLPIGQWSDYLSYQKGLTVCQGGGYIYCTCSSGVFSYNLSDNSIQRYNKVTGLSDIGCTVARYNTFSNTLVIGYSNGNIDLLQNNQVTNISDLKNSSAQGSKTINDIYFANNLAYISCGQGVIVLDLNQNIILEVCNIGHLGSALNVHDITIFNNTIYAATDSGIHYAPLDTNITDFQDWKVVSQHLPGGVYNGIITCGSKMYASFSKRLTDVFRGILPPAYAQDTLFVCNSSGVWYHANIIQGNDNIYSLESSTIKNTPYLVYSGNYQINGYDTSGTPKLHIFDYGFKMPPTASDALVDNNSNLWVSDANYGLVKESPDSINFAGQSYYPPGPFSNSVFSIKTQNSTVYVAPGGYDQSINPEGLGGVGISEYSGGSWYRLIENTPTDTLPDLSCIAIDPQNPEHAFAGSYGHGIVEYNNYAVTNAYDPTNTNNALNSLYDFISPGYYSARVGGIGFDTIGNLWADNSNVNTCLIVKHAKGGEWQSFDYTGIPNFPGANAQITNMLVTKTGAKWLIFPTKGILAYQDNGTFASPSTSNSVFINTAPNNGDLPSLNIYSLAEDLNGAIWVGTDQRVVVFYSPDNVFNGPGGWDAQNVYVQQTGYTQYLMQGQFTTTIAIDGANRKWIGTLGGGAFLMSADGTQQILNFTSSNSPLLSNNVLSIAIDQQNGEVFFGTDQGMVSYRGDATAGNSSFSNVYAYPDPVPHGYSGPIAIKNLVTNADVKIATVSGEIVYHTIALGGQAVWNGTNFSGERVQTGVYLVYCTSPDGSQSLVTKLLLVN